MKKILLLLAVAAMVLPGCKKINEAIDGLDNRLDALENETIPTIDEQIAAINLSLDALEATDKELKGYIESLTKTAENLQKQINDTNTKIEEVKTALQGEISTAKADVLAQLNAVKTELEGELAQINATIETLKAKDAELDKKIADLRSYVDTELGKTTDWVNATFATLEQYNALVAEVTAIKGQIVAINQSIADLETRLTTKINEDIATAVSTLNADIQQKVKEITDGYTEAVKNAKEEITTAYKAAIATAISNLEASLKSWVGDQLSNYYTIAEVEAKILALQNAIAAGDTTLQEELNNLKTQLETAKAELTAAYKKAIEDAINKNNGVIDTKIANEIAAVNKRIDSEVATINAKIAAIEARLDNIESKLEDLLARIQSVSYIPTYDDGKATVKYSGNISRVTLDFEVSPKDAVAELAKVWQEAVSLKAVYTQTRAVSFIELPIIKFEADTENGVISVTASGENLSAEFFAGTQSASVRLSISDGNNSVTSEYIPLDERNDHLAFSPDPEFNGVGFDATVAVNYAGGERKYVATSPANFTTVRFTIGEQVLDLIAEEIPGVKLQGINTQQLYITLSDDFFNSLSGGAKVIEAYLADQDGGEVTARLPYNLQGVNSYNRVGTNLWAGTANLSATIFGTPSLVQIAYREMEGEWKVFDAAASGANTYTAEVEGLGAGRTYEYNLLIDGKTVGTPLSFATEQGVQIPNGGLDDWCKDGDGVIIPWSSSSNPYWCTGNYGTAILSKNITQSSNDVRPGSKGTKSMYMDSEYIVVKFAAGNGYIGSWGGMDGTNPKIYLGQPFEYNAKPKAIRFWAKWKSGKIDKVKGKVAKEGDPDLCKIFCALTTDRHLVDSSKAKETTFSPSDKNIKSGDARYDKVLYSAYFESTESQTEWKDITIPFTFYGKDPNQVPSHLILTFTSSGYGDFFDGSTESWLYVDDIEFIY